jgi:iron complex outermembrane receptor protein
MGAAGLLLTALLVVGAPLQAQARDRRTAAAHFQQGSALYADGHWSEALAEFQAGYDAFPLRGFLVNIGQCYRKLERYDEAADAWRRFLATHPADAQLRSEVEDALDEVERARAAAQPEAPKEKAPEVLPSVVPPPVEAPEMPQLVAQPPPPAPKKKLRPWVWAIVGVAAAGVAAAAVTVGVVESQSGPRAGSLGLIDGRR